MPRSLTLVAVGALVATGITLGAPADATARHFASCAGMQRVYPHGVGLSTAHDRTSGTPVTSFKRSRALYLANNGPRNGQTNEYDLDRDNDGIACEKR